METELTIPGWVNSAYHAYHANRLRYEEWEEEARREEEEEERLVTPQDYRGIDPRTPGYVNLVTDEPTHVMNDEELARSIEEDTRVMRRRDWVDRTHEGSRIGALGPAIVSLLAIFSLVLLVCAVVWYGAAWLDYLTPLQF